MKYLSKEDLEIYAKYEYDLTSSYMMNFKRNSSKRQNDELANIYDKYAEKPVLRDWNCGSCCLSAYKKFGKLYYDSLTYYKNLEATQAQTEETPKEETTEEPKTKKTKRTKKTTKK